MVDEMDVAEKCGGGFLKRWNGFKGLGRSGHANMDDQMGEIRAVRKRRTTMHLLDCTSTRRKTPLKPHPLTDRLRLKQENPPHDAFRPQSLPRPQRPRRRRPVDAQQDFCCRVRQQPWHWRHQARR